MNTHLRAEALLRKWLASSGISQTELAEKIGVTRAAVCKWAGAVTAPSPRHARLIDKLSQGAVPATAWSRRSVVAAPTPGAAAIQRAAVDFDGSITTLARAKKLPMRSLMRWVCGENTPRSKAIAKLNKKLNVNLKSSDFEVIA